MIELERSSPHRNQQGTTFAFDRHAGVSFLPEVVVWRGHPPNISRSQSPREEMHGANIITTPPMEVADPYSGISLSSLFA